MVLLLLIFAGVIGVFSHWLNRYLQKRETANFFHYLFVVNRTDSVKMLLSVIGTELTFYTTLDPDINVWTQAFLRTLIEQGAAAYIADSVMNRGASHDSKAPDKDVSDYTQKELDDLLESDANR